MRSCFALLAIVVVSSIGLAESPKPAPRLLLYPATFDAVPEALRCDVAKLLDPRTAPVAPGDAKACGVYARVLSRRFVLDGANLGAKAVLARRPFVFLTVPETLYGRSLLDIYSAIGYDAKDVLVGQVGDEKVAVIFRYGDAPPEGVYAATWENLFGLAERMAPNLMKLGIGSEREVAFVAGFPAAGKDRIKSTPYAVLRHVGGADWDYRQFLERAFGASEHYAGSGRTKLTLAAGPSDGFPEFLGPNRELKALPEIAIIGLGTLRLAEDAPAK